MKLFWVKVRFKNEMDVGRLMRAFFDEFNPESSIITLEKDAEVKIVFDQNPPAGIVDAISYGAIRESRYYKNLKEYVENEIVQVETENDSEQERSVVESLGPTEQVVVEDKTTEQAVAEKENAEQTEQPKKKKGRSTTKKAVPSKTGDVKKTVNVPELEEIAKKATSFEEFVKLVAEWLEMEKRQEFFENLAITSTEVFNISWKALENKLKNKGVNYSSGDKTWASNQVSKKLQKYSATMLPFLHAISQYKDYTFESIVIQADEEKNAGREKIDQNDEGNKAEEPDKNVIPKPRVKMECMPEIKAFEEALASVDKAQPVEERVCYVLNAMNPTGLSKKSAKEWKWMEDIVSTAVRRKNIDIKSIVLEANIPADQAGIARMTLSQYVNDFVQLYESNKLVKLEDFLSELQRIIMFDSEIKNNLVD